LEFIGKVAPIKSCNDKQLVSHDSKSNDSQDQRSYCGLLISNNLDKNKGESQQITKKIHAPQFENRFAV